MLRIVLTGATGFVGRHFFTRYKNCDPNIVPVVRSTEKGITLGVENFLVFHEMTGGMLNDKGLKSSCLIHLIGASRDERNCSMWDSIVETTRSVILAARESDIQRIIYLSGYGVNAQSAEGNYMAKWEAEEIIRSSGIPYTIFRCSYILGPGDELTPYLIEQLKEGRVEIPGDGSYRIQPLHIDDVVSVLYNATKEETFKSHTFNLLGCPITYANFVELLASKIYPKAVISHVDLETFIRRAISSPDPDFTTSELAVLIGDRVGPPTVTCLGVKIRGIEEIVKDLVLRQT